LFPFKGCVCNGNNGKGTLSSLQLFSTALRIHVTELTLQQESPEILDLHAEAVQSSSNFTTYLSQINFNITHAYVSEVVFSLEVFKQILKAFLVPLTVGPTMYNHLDYRYRLRVGQPVFDPRK
jgi:hypothetical protein